MKMARWLANADGWWSIGRNSLGSAGLVVAVNNPPTSYYYHQLYRRSACAWIGIIIVYQMYILGTAAHLSSRLLLGSSSCAFIVWSSLWANYTNRTSTFSRTRWAMVNVTAVMMLCGKRVISRLIEQLPTPEQVMTWNRFLIGSTHIHQSKLFNWVGDWPWQWTPNNGCFRTTSLNNSNCPRRCTCIILDTRCLLLFVPETRREIHRQWL